MVSTSHSSSIDKFVMQRPKIQMKNVSWNIENELEQLRKILIESFFQPATTCTDIIIKRKLGILTSDVCDYYRFKKKTNSVSTEVFNLLPNIHYDDNETLSNSLDNLQHSCTTCPLDLVLVDDTQLNSSLWSHVYMCDICHCTRASEDNMIRHLETELHLSATEYQADSATMTLNHCIRRSCIQLCKHDTNMLDSIITCPICYELFSNVNSCAIHSHLSHNMDYIYSIVSVLKTFDTSIQQDDLAIGCDEYGKIESLLVDGLDKLKDESQEASKLICVILCPANKCYYQTKYILEFKKHLISMHSHILTSLDKTIKVKIKQFLKPQTYKHIARFLHKNQTDINEELKALEQLEYDMQYLPNDKNTLKIIKKRYDLLQNV